MPRTAITARERLYPEIKRLREDEGLVFRVIGERLGISLKSANDYYRDPTGEKAQARKDRNNGVCVDCGGDTRNGGSIINIPVRCRRCAIERDRTIDRRRARSLATRGKNQRWTDDAIFAAIRSLADPDGLITLTTYKAAYERQRRGSLPSVAIITRRFGLWTDAVEAAGCHTTGRIGPYSSRLTEEGCALAIQECRADLGAWPSHKQYDEWAHRVGAPVATTIRARMGWMEAVNYAIDMEARNGS